MKRSATDVLRRGFDSTIANWQLLLIRIGESVLMFAIVMIAILATIVEFVAFGRQTGVSIDQPTPQRVAEVFTNMMEWRWDLIVYFLVLATLVLGAMLAIHSFVQGGSIRVYAEAERRAASVASPARKDFEAFQATTFFAGAKATWWRIFWIYNFIAGIAGLVMLLPLIPIFVPIIVTQGAPAGIALSCLLGIVVFFIVIAATIVAAVWTEKAIVVCVVRREGVRASVRIARRQIQEDFARHLIVAFVIAVLAFGAAGMASTVSMGASFGARNPMSFFFAPVQLFSSFAQTLVGAVVGSWFLAAFVTLTTER